MNCCGIRRWLSSLIFVFSSCALEQPVIESDSENEIPKNEDDNNSSGENNDGGNSEQFSITAHIDESCDTSVFAGFVITINFEESTCNDRFLTDNGYIQLTVGESLESRLKLIALTL